MRTIVLFFALASLAACRSTEPEPPQVHYGTYALFLLARPGGSEPLPPGFQRGEELFEQARLAYERGDYQQSAGGFVAAAEALRVDKGAPYWEAAKADRVWSYRNAAYGWAMANALDQARAALEAAAAADPLCADELRQLLQKLPAPVRH